MRPPTDGITSGVINNQANYDENLKRRHWHDGTNAPYHKHALINYWNTQLDKINNENTKDHPNGIYVAKTIYDPSPAGYKISSPNAFTGYYTGTALNRTIQASEKKQNNGMQIGWTLSTGSSEIFYPATGVRNIGLKNRDHTWGTFPGFADLTFISSAGFVYNEKSSSKYSCTLFSIDNRKSGTIRSNYATSNSYGLTQRPILDQAK